MSKLSHIFQSCRNHLFQKRLPGEDVKVSFLFASRACMSTAGQKFAADGKISDRVFANYSIFKGKAALSVAPALPTFSKLDSGDLRMDRRGVIMLTFRPAIGERKYDNEKKQLFALSATEVGSFISLGPNDTCEFFHDPSMLSSNAGQVRKSLSVKPLGDGNGYFISLNAIVYPLGCWFKRDSSPGDDTKLPQASKNTIEESRGGRIVQHHLDWNSTFLKASVRKLGAVFHNVDVRTCVVNNILNTNDRFTVPVTKAEFAVMREAFSFALPHIMGWAACTRQTWKRVEDNPSKVLPQRMDSEWDR